MKLGGNQQIVYQIIKAHQPINRNAIKQYVLEQDHKIDNPNKVIKSLIDKGIVEQNNETFSVSIEINLDYEQEGDDTDKPRIRFVNKPMSDIEALHFLIYTLQEFYRRGIDKDISRDELDKYFTKSDRFFLDQHNQLSDINFIYKELAYHAQNGTKIESIIKFNEMEEHIKSFSYDYTPSNHFKSFNEFKNCDVYRRYSGYNLEVLERYYFCLKDINTFLLGCNEAADVKSKIIEKGESPRTIYRNFKNNCVKNCYGEALIFDFIKEFGRVFNIEEFDYPKPDLHVKRTMSFLCNNEARSYREDTTGFNVDSLNSFKAIELHKEIIEKAKREYNNHNLAGGEKIKNYILDKAIFVVCSGLFYLHSTQKNRFPGIEYTKHVCDRTFENVDLNWFSDFLARL